MPSSASRHDADQRRVHAHGRARRDLGHGGRGADGLRAQVAHLAGRVGALQRGEVDHRHGKADALLLGGRLDGALAEHGGALLDADPVDMWQATDHTLSMARQISPPQCDVQPSSSSTPAGWARCPTRTSTRATPAPTRSATSPSGSAASTCPRSDGSGSARSSRSRACRRPAAPVVHGRLHPLGPGKESTTGHWELMGVVPRAPAAHLSARLPARGGRGARARHRPPLLLQPAVQRHRGDRRLRRPPPRDRRADPLHLGGLGAPDRRARGRAGRARPVRGLRDGARADERRAPRGPGDRAPVRGRRRARSSAARAGATTPRRRPDARTSRSCRTPACRCTVWARSATCSPEWASTPSTTAPPTPRASPRPRR